MITYANLIRHPAAASSLIGMPLSAFDVLWADFEVTHRQRLRARTVTKRTKA